MVVLFSIERELNYDPVEFIKYMALSLFLKIARIFALIQQQIRERSIVYVFFGLFFFSTLMNYTFNIQFKQSVDAWSSGN